MKRIRLFAGLSLLCIFSLQAVAQEVVQGFEDPVLSGGWKAVNVQGAQSWQISRATAHTGAQSIYLAPETVDNGVGGAGENWLITPKVYQVQAGDKLTFWFAAAVNDNSTGWFENLEIWVSATTNDIASFSMIPGATTSLKNQSVTFQQVTVDLSTYAGQNIYLAFRDNQNQGVGVYLDDVTVTSKLASDAGSKGSNLPFNAIFSAGQSISFTDTVFNFGSGNLAAGIPVKYRVNGGSSVTVNTATAISSGSYGVVNFTGANAFTPSSSGSYTVEIYTDLAGELNRNNDTLRYQILVQDPVSSFPYYTDFGNAQNWTTAGNGYWKISNYFQPAGSPTQTNVIDPSGGNSKVAYALTYTSSNQVFLLRSPLLNFSSLAKPVMSFYVAAAVGASSDTYYDTLQVLVSLDGGLTYQTAPKLYDKSSKSGYSSVLESVYNTNIYIPGQASDWRHEIIDLSNYAGVSNLLIAFKVGSHLGNNVWIDDVNFFDAPASYYSATKLTSPTQTVNGSLSSSVKFNSAPAILDTIHIVGYNVQPSYNNFLPNTSATSNDGSIESPNVVLSRYFTVAYSGNEITRANYDISIDITGMIGALNPQKFYILKRADQSDRWVALSTTLTGNTLKAAGLNNFCDFAIGYFSSAAPVTLVSFNGQGQEDAVVLTWKTAQEMNIDKYEIQKLIAGTWGTIGVVNSTRGVLQNSYGFTDVAPVMGANLYRLKILGISGEISYSDVVSVDFKSNLNKVFQNVPNPFKEYTIIRYDIVKKSSVELVVYDINGRQIDILQNGVQNAGSYEVRWEPKNLPSGNYYYRVNIDGQGTTRSMIKIR